MQENQDEILVGISLLCYNHAPYLRRCLDSIVNQKVNFRFQVVIGEDCSTDNSREILKEYEEKYPDIFVMLYNEKNLGGTANAMNVKKYLKGKYICAGESDDFWTDEYRLQKQVDFLEAHPEYVAVASNHYKVDADGNNPVPMLLKWQVNKKYTLKDYLKYGYVLHGNSMMRRNILPIDGEKYLKLRSVATTMGDTISKTLLYDKGPVFCMPDVMHAHRSGAKNPTSFSASNKSRAIEYAYMYCRIINALEEYFDGKYKLYALKADRTAILMLQKYIYKYNIDKKEYKEYLKSLDRKTLNKARAKFMQKMCTLAWHKVARKLKLFYKEKK